MKKASISETKNNLSALLDVVRRGESVLITDRNQPVAVLEPATGWMGEDADGRLAALERGGLLRRAKQKLPAGFLRGPLPTPAKGASALQALVDERREGR